jgi:hypothetical protein
MRPRKGTAMTTNPIDRNAGGDTSGGDFAIHHAGAAACDSYRAGHDTHYIQVLRVAQRGTPVALRDVRLVDPVTFEVDVDTQAGAGRETLVLRNHDALQVLATWKRHGRGRLVHGASLLQIGAPTGMASFSVTGGELGPCGSSGFGGGA